MGKIPLSYGSELQAHPMAGGHMSHEGLNADLSFLHQKIQFRCRTDRHPYGRVNEQPAQAKIPNRGSIAVSSTVPVHPHTFGGLNS